MHFLVFGYLPFFRRAKRKELSPSQTPYPYVFTDSHFESSILCLDTLHLKFMKMFQFTPTVNVDIVDKVIRVNSYFSNF